MACPNRSRAAGYSDQDKNKTVIKGKTTLTLLKKIFDKRSEKSFDWAFATNQSEINLDSFIATYKCRWRIETGFRIQDEAHNNVQIDSCQNSFFFILYMNKYFSFYGLFFIKMR